MVETQMRDHHRYSFAAYHYKVNTTSTLGNSTIMEPLQPLGLVEGIRHLADLSARVFYDLFDLLRDASRPPRLSKEFRDDALLLSDVLQRLKSTMKSIPTTLPSTGETSLAALQEAVSQSRATLETIATDIRREEGLVDERRLWKFTHTENAEYVEKLRAYKDTFASVLNATERYVPHP
jgi:hypothetical protein